MPTSMLRTDREMEVYDFTSMYDKFVHADMKQKQRQVTALVFDYMKGNTIFKELDDFTGRHGFKRVSGQRFNTIEIIYESSDSKGVTAISYHLLRTLCITVS
jgi:hypothetical protein